jgi:hypothetical protein
VSRIPARTRPPKVLWRAYVRRFDLEHTIRFCKQTLGWTTPRARHPEQADRWTWLVLAAYTQLRLARASVADQRLPWERHLPSTRLTPVRVRRGFPRLLCTLVHRPARRNPAGAHQVGPRAAVPDLPSGIRRPKDPVNHNDNTRAPSAAIAARRASHRG